jgi:tetratricopeptide (TPR) repeat protein
MNTPPFDLAKAHRWFAIELNNRAWDLVEKADRTDAETAEMIHAAHAAAFHWSKAGTEINAVRALNLLATVYASAGRAASASEYAQESFAALEQLSEPATAFDRAAIVGSLAQTATLTGRFNDAEVHYDAAAKLWSELEPDDRAVLERLYGRR